MNIDQPDQHGTGLDRDLQCEVALAPAFDQLVDAAAVVGWSEDEVANALLSLAQYRVQVIRDNALIGLCIPADRTAH